MITERVTKQKRRKGGGRKFQDGSITKRRFKNILRKEFEYQYSIKGFLRKTRISRQAFYRFLNNNPKLKAEITDHRQRLIRKEEKERKEMFQFLKENPDKTLTDFYFRNLEEIKVPDIKLGEIKPNL